MHPGAFQNPDAQVTLRPIKSVSQSEFDYIVFQIPSNSNTSWVIRMIEYLIYIQISK